MIVDSLLVRDHRAVGLELHRRRFGAGYPDLARAVPAEGEWFPRISREGGERAEVELRPAPSLRESTVLWVPPESDPRRAPRLKGPDLEALGELRARAREQGADDALLWGARGVYEAANAALVFFDGRECIAGPAARTLESTTVAASVAAGLIPQPRRREISLEQALALPALAASALHGWTPVVGWRLGAEELAAPAWGGEVAELNRRLWERADRV